MSATPSSPKCPQYEDLVFIEERCGMTLETSINQDGDLVYEWFPAAPFPPASASGRSK